MSDCGGCVLDISTPEKIIYILYKAGHLIVCRPNLTVHSEKPLVKHKNYSNFFITMTEMR